MKEIPNKIYIDEDLINYHCLTYRCDGDLEYIRKDYLLGWANSWLAFKRSGVALDDGFCCAMEELIKKLNEM